MNVKPGDLAIIMSCGLEKYADCIGRIVSVARPSLLFVDSWIIEFCGEVPQSVIGPVPVSVPDHCLRPVSGLLDTEHTDEREPIKELA